FKPLAALKPTVHVDCVLDAMLTNAAGSGTQHVVASNVDDNPYYKAFSALIDYGFALTILIGFWWLLLIIAAWIRISSSGPAIFAQERVGKHGRIFTCYKFRTMAVGTRQAGTHEVSSASITTAGAFLRRTKLDELPQVINLLKGELRLVGPRPGLPVQDQLYNAREAIGVFAVTPGITGWAQIHDVDMSDPDKLARWDADYIAIRGVLMDLTIIIATGLGRGKGDRTLTEN
ncbi:MAG: sugar transferase, partial [Cellvibrionaceae bacterium]